MDFVNAVAWMSHREDHHPDMKVSYNKCEVRLQHAFGEGLVRKRFHLRGKSECADRIIASAIARIRQTDRAHRRLPKR